MVGTGKIFFFFFLNPGLMFKHHSSVKYNGVRWNLVMLGITFGFFNYVFSRYSMDYYI